MGTFVFIIISVFFLIGILFVVIKPFVWGYRVLPRSIFFPVSILSVCLVFLFFEYEHKKRVLNLVPATLRVDNILYSASSPTAIGPGSEMSTIIIYELPREISATLETEGIGFFVRMSKARKRDVDKRFGRLLSWQKTPLVPDERQWRVRRPGDLHIEYAIPYYSSRIDPKFADIANKIINSEGSYYSYSNYETVIVSPKYQLVIYTWTH